MRLLLPQTEALHEAWPAGVPERIELGEVPFFPQKEYQRGPAALATPLVHFGVKITPEDLVEQVYLPARQGSLQVEMLAAPLLPTMRSAGSTRCKHKLLPPAQKPAKAPA